MFCLTHLFNAPTPVFEARKHPSFIDFSIHGTVPHYGKLIRLLWKHFDDVIQCSIPRSYLVSWSQSWQRCDNSLGKAIKKMRVWLLCSFVYRVIKEVWLYGWIYTTRVYASFPLTSPHIWKNMREGTKTSRTSALAWPSTNLLALLISVTMSKWGAAQCVRAVVPCPQMPVVSRAFGFTFTPTVFRPTGSAWKWRFCVLALCPLQTVEARSARCWNKNRCLKREPGWIAWHQFCAARLALDSMFYY